MGVLLTSTEYSALLKRIEKLEECCDRLSNPEPEPDKHYLETPGLTDAQAFSWMFNNIEPNILRSGRLAMYRSVGIKSVKLEWLLKSNHADQFSGRMSEAKMVAKIIELRAIEPFTIS